MRIFTYQTGDIPINRQSPNLQNAFVARVGSVGSALEFVGRIGLGLVLGLVFGYMSPCS